MVEFVKKGIGHTEICPSGHNGSTRAKWVTFRLLSFSPN